MALKILLTGGAGYIGSHTYLSLVGAGHEPVIVDNFQNSSPRVIDRLGQLVQRKPVFYEVDVHDSIAIEQIIRSEKIGAVVHFAGLKSILESQKTPLKYLEANVSGTERLVTAMKNAGCRKLIFSSSAVVYGEPQYLPIDETHPLKTLNVYGRTKLMVEDMLRALFKAEPDWSITMLRYFNPVGAHTTGEIGEDPKGTPDNLMPFVSQVAVGRLPELSVFGHDYDTSDGTGVRDFIHVCDLADGHVAALPMLEKAQCTAINLGTGRGYTVLDIVKGFEKASGRTIPYRLADRRDGDVSACYASAELAKDLLGWSAQKGLDEICEDTWRWQNANPDGY